MPTPPKTVATIQRVLAGEPDAFQILVRDYGLQIRAYLGGQIFRRDDVEEVAQDTFITAFKNLDKFDPERDFSSWLHGIARHRLLNYFRRIQRRNSAIDRYAEKMQSEIVAGLDGAAAQHKSDRIGALLSCIERLPTRMKEIVRAGLDGDRPANIADSLNVTPATIYNLSYRANALLRECVEQEEHNT